MIGGRIVPRQDWLGAAFVLVVTQIAYLLTVTVSCPFWDSGEYIATSYTLGIPHPPGTPLYVLIGRVFSMVPLFPQIATRVNYLSAFASSLACVFTYLIVIEVLRRQGGRRGRTYRERRAERFAESTVDEPARPVGWIGFCAGAVAAFFVAFGRTFWDNAIEAEVYAASSMIMALCVWLILLWARPGDRARRTGIFVLLYYLVCLSIGIHLGTFLVVPPIILFALLVERRIFGQGAVAALVVAGLLMAIHPGLLPTIGWKLWLPILSIVLLLSVAASVRPIHPAFGPRGLLTWCAIAAILGLSTHAYLMIRASLHPFINEADPSNWDALWKVLIRDQYKPPNPFETRQAPWGVQFDRHFFQYAKDQYALGLAPAWMGNLIPYLIGWVGLGWHFLREKKSFVLLLAIYLITSVAMVFYLNFREDEVRPRDYFFVASFQFFAIWIGLGVAAILEMFGATAAADEAEEGAATPVRAASPRWMLYLAGALTICLPLLTMRHYWFTHDRTEFHVATDYAYNILQPLQPNAIIFTNGDNDTFPLWYIQAVENLRTDVRVVNLSLLNTDWYLRQLRDDAPRIDLAWSDEEIQFASDYPLVKAMSDASYGGWNRQRLEAFLDQTGLRPYVRDLEEQLLTKDLAVARIIDREYGKRPIYIAVTVPDAMGLEPRMVMEGLVFRIEEPVPEHPERLDLDRTLHVVHDVYRFRGILKPDGTHDHDVYKDENSRRLTQNYSAALIQAADEQFVRGDRSGALRSIELAQEISPTSNAIDFSLGVLFLRHQEWELAEEQFSGLIERGYRPVLAYRYLGRAQEALGRLEDAEFSYRRALAADPADFEGMRDLFSFLWEVRRDGEAALAVLEDWLRQHPEDRDIAAVYQSYRDSLARAGGADSGGAP